MVKHNLLAFPRTWLLLWWKLRSQYEDGHCRTQYLHLLHQTWLPFQMHLESGWFHIRKRIFEYAAIVTENDWGFVCWLASWLLFVSRWTHIISILVHVYYPSPHSHDRYTTLLDILDLLSNIPLPQDRRCKSLAYFHIVFIGVASDNGNTVAKFRLQSIGQYSLKKNKHDLKTIWNQIKIEK